jgi:hypothetical protein
MHFYAKTKIAHKLCLHRNNLISKLNGQLHASVVLHPGNEVAVMSFEGSRHVEGEGKM